MSFYTEPEKKIPVLDHVDVLVVGSGPAGFSAAVSAARQGAKTMIIEQFGEIGGVSTIGMMSHWTGHSKGGIYDEIIRRSNENTPQKKGLRKYINPEILKTLYISMLNESDVDILLYTMAVAPIMEGCKIQGVIIENKSGRQAIMAGMIIDASGDGDIAARAGAPYSMGREKDELMQPVTLMFKIGGVNTFLAPFPGCFEDNIRIPKGRIQDLGKKQLPHPAGHVLLYRTAQPGVVTCNMTNVCGIDGTDAADLTKGHIQARLQIEPIIKFLRQNVPGFKKCYNISTASFLGVRETRHFKGEYTLNEFDILEARVFDDWVVSNAHFDFDVHNLTGNGLDETGVQKKFPQKKGYTIPIACLIPQNVENLLLAGRNISGTHLAHSSYRVMPICANVGQAAGTIAALCTQRRKAPKDIPISEIQEILLKNGMLEPQ